MSLPPLQAAPPPFQGAGELCALGNALCWGVGSVLFARAFRRYRPRDAALYKNGVSLLVLGLLAFLAGSGLEGGAAGPGDLPWLLLSGFLALALGDWLFFVAMDHVGVSRTVILVMLTPVSTAAAAWAILGETLTPLQWAGGALVVAGGILAESRRLEGRPGELRGVLAALGAVAAFTAGNLTTRWGLDTTGTLTGAAWRLAGGTAGMLLLAGRPGRALGRLRPLASAHRELLPASLVGTAAGLALLAGALRWAPQGVATGHGGSPAGRPGDAQGPAGPRPGRAGGAPRGRAVRPGAGRADRGRAGPPPQRGSPPDPAGQRGSAP